MADYTGGALPYGPGLGFGGAPFAYEGALPYSSALAFSGNPYSGPLAYMQRVYDLTLAAWCYYTKTDLDPTPLATTTTPNHTGNLLAGSHSIVRAYELP